MPETQQSAASDELILRGRIIVLEKAFALKLAPEESAACTTRETTTSMLVGKLGAVVGGPTLRRGALAAVRDALHELARADRESIDEATPLAPLFPPFWRLQRWRALAKTLRCRLPFPHARWGHLAITAPVLAVHVAFIWTYPRHRYVEESMMTTLPALGVLGLVGVCAVRLAVGLPERMRTVEAVVTWLVAQEPERFRGGTAWTTGQIDEVVDAGLRLRYVRGGCLHALGPQLLVPVSVLAVVATTIALLALGFTSHFVVDPLPPSLR